MRKNIILVAYVSLLLLVPNQNLILGNKMTESIIAQTNNTYGTSIDMPLEMIISRRMSIRNFDLTIIVPPELVSKVLWAAYGSSWTGRTVPSFSNYPIVIYVSNETATYKFFPENQSFTLWKDGDHRRFGGSWNIEAPTQLYIVLDTNICPDMLWGSAESGCIIQNIYLIANALNLGTVCQHPNKTDIDQGLGLPLNEKSLYKMPLGYPLSPYTDYQHLVLTNRQSSPELPEIQDSNIPFEDALNSVFRSHEWSENPITKQELSQILWVSYGYSYYEDTAASPPKRHRTVPSAHAYYPMKVYATNSSGVYEYLPEQHTITKINAGDRRSSIAQSSGNPWASSAPFIFVIAYIEDTRPWIGGQDTYTEIGLITQNIYLESAACGLIADWGKADTDEEAMKEALGVTGETELHPVSIITIGHPSTYLHKVEWDETIYQIETNTNSTILNFQFDQPNRRISFNVSGPSETQGFCNVTIPNSLLWGDFTMLIDGNPETTLKQNNNSTHTSLHFTYEILNTLNVQIISEYVIPEFRAWTPTLILMVLMFTLIIHKRKNSKNS